MHSGILNNEPIFFQWPTMDPFLFCVHHLDQYPKSNGSYGPDESLSGREIGNDFEGKDGWRMYHGKEIPGFPGHPHRGFETVTVVERGFVDHADSLGAAGRYANGDVQWMTAGEGVQHSEMFPLLDRNPDNAVELFQIWLNLPAKDKMVSPYFTMHWSEKIPILQIPDSNQKITQLKIVAGEYQGTRGLPCPPNSWAANPKNHVWIWILELEPNASFVLPATESGIHRNIYYYEGEGLAILSPKNSEQKFSPPSQSRTQIQSHTDTQLINGNQISKLLVLQGRPINEPVVQYGPFVMNHPEEIQKAFQDYQQTQFGGWPWDRYDVVHHDRNRFAIHADGREETPS
jgi:quercetin 2,3-dioxygenase